MDEWLEDFWGELLSEEPMRIIAAWDLLDAEAQLAIRAHLQRMTTETGWADVQRDAAGSALAAIETEDKKNT